MNGLRIYTNIEVPERHGGYPVFYRRCHDGPYYRWSCSDDSREWQVCHVQPAVFSQRMLTSTPVKTIPAPLRTNLAESASTTASTLCWPRLPASYEGIASAFLSVTA
jgi:hypothetical protein